MSDAGDAAGFGEAHVLPGLAGVGRLIDAVAHDVAVADHPRLAGADPDDVRIGVGDGDRADRGDRLVVEDRHEGLCRRRWTSTRRRTRSRGSTCWDRQGRRQPSRCARPGPGPCSGTSAVRESSSAAGRRARRAAPTRSRSSETAVSRASPSRTTGISHHHSSAESARIVAQAGRLALSNCRTVELSN